MIQIKVKKRLKGSSNEFLLDVDIHIKNGEFISLFGKSGSGKTTLLRMIAGLTQADEGFIKVNNKLWFSSAEKVNIPPQKRKVGFVFQDYALFPNMTVKENIEFAMEYRDEEFLEELLEITELKELKDRKPNSLSGGQKQRVALARAVARKPEILLLDEPLSALDYETRLKLQEEIEKIHHRFNLTTILVSHDFSEIFRLSDRVFVISEGKILKQGKPTEIFIQEKLSGKVKFSGRVLEIKKEDIVYVVSVLIGNQIIRVVATEEEINGLKVGDNVIVATKAFNPFILKSDISSN